MISVARAGSREGGKMKAFGEGREAACRVVASRDVVMDRSRERFVCILIGGIVEILNARIWVLEGVWVSSGPHTFTNLTTMPKIGVPPHTEDLSTPF